MEQERLIPQHRQIAQLILGFSPDLITMQHQQWQILGNLNAENMFRIDQEKQTIFIMNEMFHISFALVHNQHTPFIQYIGRVYSFIVPFGFAIIPIIVYGRNNLWW